MSFALLRVTWMQLLIYCSTVFQYTLKYHIILHLNALLLFQFGQKQNCRTRQQDIREYDKVQRKITQKYYIHNQVKMCLHHLKISVAEPILIFFDSLFISGSGSILAPDPQNNFGSGSALAPRNTASKILTGLRLTDLNLEENYLFQASGQHSTLQPLRTR